MTILDDRSLHDPAGTRAQVATLFAPESVLAEIVRIESVLAGVQAGLGIIPNEAASAIQAGAAGWRPDPEAVMRHRAHVGHPMVAILDAFSEGIAPEGREWLHYGTTTADVFRTVGVVLLHRSVAVYDAALGRIEARLASLAATHRATPMIGRTLGRHALPITFGAKVATWLTECRRDRERLMAWAARFPSGVLSGAVGTHAAMGPLGIQVEQQVMAQLGLGAPEPIDTKGSNDLYADFGAAVAISARGCQRIAQEIFLLQGDDLREVSLSTATVGSSTMPHKSNPTLCLEVMSRAREVSASLTVLLEWIVTIFERDSALHNGALAQMCIDMAQVLSCTEGMLNQLHVHPDAMLTNIGRTRGAIYTESVTVQLAERLGRRSAHDLMRDLVARMQTTGEGLDEALATDPRCAGVTLPRPGDAIGVAPDLVDACLTRLGFSD